MQLYMRLMLCDGFSKRRVLPKHLIDSIQGLIRLEVLIESLSGQVTMSSEQCTRVGRRDRISETIRLERSHSLSG